MVLALATGAQASPIFSDNFDSYAYQLNWVPPANWSAPGPGTVDLIGQTTTETQFNFYPNNGGYVDLSGSNGIEGTLQTNDTFAAGTYTLSFALGGNARGDSAQTTRISLGDFTTAITLGSADPLKLYSFTFTTNGGLLAFSDQPGGNPNIGNILDDVTLASAVPEASTWVMMILGFLGMGFTAYGRKEKPKLRFA